MASLKQRLEEVMQAKGWEYRDLVAHSGESYSVVSQWLGRSSKEIKSIGKMVAAERLEVASGFAALWIAKGLGPQLATAATGSSPTGTFPPSLAEALPVVLDAIAQAKERTELRALLPLLVDTDAPAYRQRLHELLSSAPASAATALDAAADEAAALAAAYAALQGDVQRALAIKGDAPQSPRFTPQRLGTTERRE